MLLNESLGLLNLLLQRLFMRIVVLFALAAIRCSKWVPGEGVRA